MNAVKRTLLPVLVLGLFGLTACGQRGDLTLPKEPAPVSAPATEADPAAAQQQPTES